MVDRPSNRDVIVYAIAALGGDSQFVHTEGIAIKCHQLAPDAFSWRKHTHHPDLEVARRALLNMRSAEFGALVEGRSGEGPRKGDGRTGDGWQLTAAGREWVTANGDRVEGALNSTALSDRRQRVLQQLRRVYAHSTWSEFSDDPNTFSPSRGDLAELLRVRVDAPDEVWSSRFDEIMGRAVLIQDQELIQFAKQCRSVYESVNQKGSR